MSKAELYSSGLQKKGFMFTIKGLGLSKQPRKSIFLTSAVANGRTLPLRKVSLGSDEVLMSYYLFVAMNHMAMLSLEI